MKLKTLKDLEHGKITWPRTEDKECVRVSELKEEAIKWVKIWEENWDLVDGPVFIPLADFMEFHNITEEDLNTEEDLK